MTILLYDTLPWLTLDSYLLWCPGTLQDAFCVTIKPYSSLLGYVSSKFMRNEPFMGSFLEVGLGWHSHESVRVGDLAPGGHWARDFNVGLMASVGHCILLWQPLGGGLFSSAQWHLINEVLWIEHSLWCWHWTQPLYSDTGQGHWGRDQGLVYELILGERAGWSSSLASSWDWSSQPLLRLKVIY